MTPYPVTRYQWAPKAPEIPADLWSAIAKPNQAIAKRLRRERRAFEIVEIREGRFTVRPTP